MEASIKLDNDDTLRVKADRHALRLWRGVGGATIELSLEIARYVIAQQGDPPPKEDWPVFPAEERLRITGGLYLSTGVPQQDRRYLCALESEQLVTAVPTTYGFRMRGFITDHQLRIIEELRAGADDFWLIVALRVFQIVRKPARFHEATGELTIDVESGEWLRRLREATKGTFFEVQVPMDGGTDYANAEQELEKAKALLAINNIDGALLAARKALETVRKAMQTASLVRAVLKREQGVAGNIEHQRTVPERFAFIVEDVFRAESGALHREEGTKGYDYSRAQAVTLIVTTAGLVAQLADQRRQI